MDTHKSEAQSFLKLKRIYVFEETHTFLPAGEAAARDLP